MRSLNDDADLNLKNRLAIFRRAGAAHHNNALEELHLVLTSYK